MPTLTMLASVVVLLAGLYLIGLAAVAFVSPARAKSFLSSFAGSARAHYSELLIRLVVGAAFVIFAPEMKFPVIFLVFGWVLIVTTIVLVVLPWRWHHRFASWSVPMATRRMRLLALGALAGGVFVLVSAFLGAIS